MLQEVKLTIRKLEHIEENACRQALIRVIPNVIGVKFETDEELDGMIATVIYKEDEEIEPSQIVDTLIDITENVIVTTEEVYQGYNLLKVITKVFMNVEDYTRNHSVVYLDELIG